MAVHKMLSAARIAATLPGPKDIWLSDDDGARGAGRLVLRVTPTGQRRFYYRLPRTNGCSKKYVLIGPYSRVKAAGCYTLMQARMEARRLAAVPQQDSCEPPRPALQPAVCSAPSVSVEALCRTYSQALYDDKKYSASDVENLFKRFIYGTPIGRLPANEVDAVAFTDFLRGIRERSGPTARKLRTALHSAYAQAMRASTDPAAPKDFAASGIKSNPIQSIASLSQFNQARNRVLTTSELAGLWRFLNPHDDSVTMTMRALRLDLLLGGQRAEQLMRATRFDVDLEAATLRLFDPKGRRRKPREHLLPLTARAQSEVAWLIRHSEDVGSDYLFASSQGGNKALHANTMSKLVRTISRDLLAVGKSAAPFQYLDLRRTIETKLGTLGVPPHVRGHLQSHGLSGVQIKHYDMNDYRPQMLQALQIWTEFVDQLIDCER